MKIPVLLILLIASTALTAQSIIPKIGSTTTQEQASVPATPQDPLGRSTPRGTILGFTKAAQSGDYKQAAQYLQLTAAERKQGPEQLARELSMVLNSGFVGSVLRLSDRSDGTSQSDLAADRERAGRLAAGDVTADLLLTRVSSANGDIWLISQETMAHVPDLYAEITTERFEEKLPGVLVNSSFAGIAWWQWIAVVIAAPLCWVLAWGVAYLISRVPKMKRLAALSGGRPSERPPLLLPNTVLLACILDYITIRQLGLPLFSRFYYVRTLVVIFLSAFCWWAWRFIARLGEMGQLRAVAQGDLSKRSIVILGERFTRVAICVLVLFALLKTLGFDMTAAVAGLGIGGLAIAFAAQKTLENLLGGVTLISDQVIRVGEECRLGTFSGIVEDISLRSTRIRTAERTELSIPNGSLSTMTIENLTRRDKILITSKLAIRQDISPERFARLLEAIRSMLREHPQIESDSVRVRWIDISESAFTVEVFCYALTVSAPQFYEIREDCLMKILNIIFAEGAALAYPSRTVYTGSSEKQPESAAIDNSNHSPQSNNEKALRHGA